MKSKGKGDAELYAGAGLGIVGVGGAIAGAVCPICVIGAPILLGLGAYKKLGKKA